MQNQYIFRKLSSIFLTAVFSVVAFMWFTAYAQEAEDKIETSGDSAGSSQIPEINSGSKVDRRGKIENLTEESDDDYLRLDKNTVLWFYHVKYKDASVLAKYLPSIAGAPKKMFVYGKDTLPVGLNARDRKSVNHPGDTLIIEDSPENIEKFKKYLKIIDIPKPQVLIEARILEIKHDSEFQYGFDVDWDQASISQSFFHAADLNYSPDNWIESLQSSSTIYQGLNFDFASVGKSLTKFGIGNISIRMMSAIDDAEIMSSPRLIIEEGAYGSITSGESIYLYEVDDNKGRLTIKPIAKQIGIILTIKPIFIGKKTVKLRLEPSVSEILGYITSATYQNPIFASRSVDTITTVEYGKTLILGGLIKNENKVASRGIPILSDVPLLGELFKSHKRQKSTSELFFILTPTIVDVTKSSKTASPIIE